MLKKELVDYTFDCLTEDSENKGDFAENASENITLGVSTRQFTK